MDVAGRDNWPADVWAKGQRLKERPESLYDDKGYERTQLFWGNIALMEPPKYPQNPESGSSRGSISARRTPNIS